MDAAHARLAEINKQIVQLADEMTRILGDFDGGASGSKQEPTDRWLNTKAAMRLARVDSSSTLYRWARRFGVGEKTPAGGWRFSERKILDLLAVEKSADGENGENGDAGPLLLAKHRAHVDCEKE